MIEIVSVRFKDGGKTYYFNPNGLKLQTGDEIIIETSRGMEFGICTEPNREIDERELISPLRPVLRKATEEDRKTRQSNQDREARAMQICQKKVQEHGLDMKLVDAEYSFEGNKLTFYFTADGRVDFRALVRDLAGIFQTRIELRQIGVRDEAKMLGGLGICGRPFCCSSFLNGFHPVSIKMAKTQNLSLNPTKISGACGRLMCCLKYEQEAYEDVLSRTPKLESLVETPDGIGVVNQVQLLREKVRVRLEEDPDRPAVYSTADIRVIRNGKGKRTEGQPALQETAEPRKAAPPAEEDGEKGSVDRAESEIRAETEGTAVHRKRHRAHHRKKQEEPETGGAPAGRSGESADSN